jgi:uncharacterized FlaG/YvyC family protein
MKVNSASLNLVSSTPSDGGPFLAKTTPGEVSSATSKSDATKTVSAEGVSNTQAPSPESVAKAVEHVNEAFKQKGQALFVSIEKDKATGISVVKMTDRNTKELVSQFPEKAVIAMAAAIGESLDAKGQLIDAKA